MRIVSGQYGGRVIAAPKTAGTRPMTDKVRAALFDSLGDIEGLRVLDAYAGSGALGFEALSRGAAQVDAIESARSPIQAIHSNIKVLNVGWSYSLHQTTVEGWLARTPEATYDLILADPPYDQLRSDILEKLGGLLTDNGVLVVSHGARQPVGMLSGLNQISMRTYGDSGITVYK